MPTAGGIGFTTTLNNEAVLTLVQFHWQVVKTPVVDSFLEAAGRFLQPIGALCQ